MALSVIHCNVNGVRSSTEEKRALLNKFKIISIQDTRLRQGQNVLETLFNNYYIYETKHDNTVGIALLIHNSVNHTLIEKISRNNHNLITVKIHKSKLCPQDLYISSFHAPPRNSRFGNFPFQIKLLDKSLKYKCAITVGDFNARHSSLGCKGTNKHGRIFYKYLTHKTHIILNDARIPTFHHCAHNFSDTIDFAVSTVKAAKYIESCVIDNDIGSDHLPLAIKLKANSIAPVNATNNNNTYNIEKTNWDSFTDSLEESVINDPDLWPIPAITSPDEIISVTKNIINKIQDAVEISTPKYRTPNSDRPRLPESVLLLIRSRRLLRSQVRINPNNEIRKQINELNKSIKKQIKEVKTKIEEKKQQILRAGPRNSRFWPTVKSIFKPIAENNIAINNQGAKLTTPADKTAAFQEHFKNIFCNSEDVEFNSNFKSQVDSSLPDLTPIFNAATNITEEINNDQLTKPTSVIEITSIINSFQNRKAPGPDKIVYEHLKHAPNKLILILRAIYNAILLSGFIPPQFKSAIITIIPKANKDLTDINSYRPITLAPTLSKIFEKIINNRLLEFVTRNKIIKQHQTAFLPNKDSTENVLHVTQTIINNFNLNKYTLLLSLDIMKAFDKVWHNGVISTLLRHTSRHFCRIVKSFLEDRKIKVKFNNNTASSYFTQTCGLPQGSPLSPLLFNILISTAPYINSSNIKTYNYADDIFYASSASDPKLAWDQLKPNVDFFIQWCKDYRLKIQINKTNITFFTRRRGTPNNQYPIITINNTEIERQKHTKILGVTLDTHMNLNQHISNIDEGSKYIINNIRKIMTINRFIPPYIGVLLYKSLLRSKFTYAAPILMMIKPSTWRPLLSSEHQALRAAYRTGIRTKLASLYEKAKITPLPNHYKDLSKRVLSKLIASKNKRILLTLTITRPLNTRTFTVTPLHIVLNEFNDADKRLIHNQINDII